MARLKERRGLDRCLRQVRSRLRHHSNISRAQLYRQMCRKSVPLSKDEGAPLRYPLLAWVNHRGRLPVSDRTITVDSQEISLSSLDRVMYPDDGLTKADVVDYYLRMADTMLAHMVGRPLTMHRFPDGIDGDDFYQKEAPDYFPSWINRVLIEVEGEGQEQEQITCENAATLVYLANQNCITPHIWLSRTDHLHRPDKMIFDLDPPEDDFAIVRQAALDLHDMLQEVGLPSFLMTTGSRGLHVVTPLDGSAGFDTVRAFARQLAEALAARHPDRLTTEQRKVQRRGRLFLDYLRNSYAQNSVAPYSLRARPGAPVATPLDWDELQDPQLTSRRYTFRNIFRRLGQKADPWREFERDSVSLGEARNRLRQLPSA